MSIVVSWWNQRKRVVQQKFSDEWTMNEYYRALDTTYKFMDEVNHPVDVIINFSGNAGDFSRLLSATISEKHTSVNGKVHTNQRMIVVVGGGFYMRKIIEYGEQVAPEVTQYLFCADSLAEAQAIIHTNNATTN